MLFRSEKRFEIVLRKDLILVEKSAPFLVLKRLEKQSVVLLAVQLAQQKRFLIGQAVLSLEVAAVVTEAVVGAVATSRQLSAKNMASQMTATS